jgi:hypothetical protein
MQMPQQLRNSFVKCLLGLTLFAVLFGCGKPVIQSDLVGAYVADYSVAKEKLALLADGRFTQQVTMRSSSQILAANGTWTFDPADKRVTFHDSFLTVLDGFGQSKKQPERGTAMLPVVRRFGDVQIGDDPTAEYKKQPNR